MVIQKTIDNLKDKPNDEKKVVAGGIAIAVVAILFFGWAFLFFKKVQRGEIAPSLGGGAQSEFDFSSVREAQQQLLEDVSTFDELRNVREQSSESSAVSVQESYQQSDTDAFGQPTE